METFIQFCLAGICVLVPILLAVLGGGVYGLGMGAVRLPGVARKELTPGEDWTTVSDLARKVSESLAAFVSVAGTLFGLVGFLLPWVQVNIGAGTELLDLGALNGSLSGIALAVQPFLVGTSLLGADIEGASTVAVLLMLVSVFVWPIPLALLASAVTGVGLVSVPLGLLRLQFRRLARGLLAVSGASLILTCLFFAAIQATVGGVRVGGSEGLFGTSMSLGVQVSNGFWVTLGGALLALVGAVLAMALGPALERWSRSLSELKLQVLEQEAESK